MNNTLDANPATGGDTRGGTRGDITHFHVRLRPCTAGTDAALDFVQASLQYQVLLEHRLDVQPLVGRVAATWGIDPTLAEQILSGSRRGNFKGDTLLLEASPEDLQHVRTLAQPVDARTATTQDRVRRMQQLLEVDARTARLGVGAAGSFEQLRDLLVDLRHWCANTGTSLPKALDASFIEHMEACLVGIGKPGR